MDGRFSLWLFSFCILSMFGGCQGNDKPKEVIKIGAILALTGENAKYGLAVKNGLLMAIAEQNRLNFRLDLVDSAGDLQKAENAFHEMKNKGYQVVIGDIASHVTKHLAQLTRPNKIVLINTASSSIDLHHPGDWMIRLVLADDIFGKSMGEYLGRIGVKNVMIFSTDDQLSQWNTSSLVRAAGDHDIEVEILKSKNITKYIDKIMKSPIKDLVVVTTLEMATNLFGELKNKGIVKRKFLVGDNVMGFVEDVEFRKNCDGIYFADVAFDTGKRRQEFLSKYKMMYGGSPENYAAESYDALHLLAGAFEVLLPDGAVTAERLYNYLHALSTYKGVTGDIRILRNGDMTRQVLIRQLDKGAIRTVATIENRSVEQKK